MTRTPDRPDSLVTLGKIGKVHGIKGWLRLYSYTDPPAGISEYQQFSSVAAGVTRRFEMDQMIEQGRSLIAHFVGIDSPEQAREVIGLELQVPGKELPALPEGQYYWHELEGLL
ncbi:MAG: ribosome maturation factor RimM, partial [Pseudohongiellaceae bacterium]